MQFIPSQRQNRLQGFTGAFPLICPISAHTIRQPHKPLIHHLRRAGGHTIKRSTSADTRYHRHAGRCTAQHSRPIIIRYIRVQHSADHASPAGSAPTVCELLKCWHTVSNTNPAHLLRGQRLHLYRVSPAAVSMLFTPGGLRSGTGSTVRAHRLVPSTRRGSPAAGERRAARNH